MKFIRNNSIFLILILLFIVVRLLVVGQIYHQDEHRWIMQADSQFNENSPHPPLAKYYFRVIGSLLGFDNLRWAPLFFSIGAALLIYFVSLEISKNKKTALWALALFGINIYSVIASVQIDIDGAILPFFVLFGYLAYAKSLKADKINYLWLVIFALTILGGILSKLSFAIFLAAFIIDYFLYLYSDSDRDSLKVAISTFNKIGLPLFGLGLIFYFLYSKESGGVIIEYAKHFRSFNFAERAYFDLAFKVLKSVVWLSPLLFLPTIYGLFTGPVFRRYLFWFVYLFISVVFYLILFDFSTLTIERYFMFLIVPTILISAEIISNFSQKFYKKDICYFILIFFVFSGILFLSHNILPLNPKEAYVESIKHLNFNFLIPFSGGSGPVGIYFSAQYILWSWILSFIFLTISVFRKYGNWSLLFLIFSIGYNVLFTAEYVTGYFFGSINGITKQTVEYVLANDKIGKVITYYDIGAYELKMSGKYSSRFYTAPKRDYTKKLSEFSNYYMIVDFPAIDKKGRYWPLIERCKNVKTFQDKYVKSYIFNCAEKEV